VVLRLRIRICYRDICLDGIGIANTGFASREPEITLPEHIARALLGEKASFTLIERVLADGSHIVLPRTIETLDLYILTEDRVEGPVKVYAYLVKGKAILLSDNTLKALHIVIIDPAEGIWCFRNEIGVRERRGL